MTGELLARIAVQLFLAGFLAAAVTKIVDLIRNTFKLAGVRPPDVTWNIAAFSVGIGIALSGFNAFAGIIPAERVGEVMTGLLLGGGSGIWHELMDRWSAQAKS